MSQSKMFGIVCFLIITFTAGLYANSSYAQDYTSCSDVTWYNPSRTTLRVTLPACGPDRYDRASVSCRNKGGRVCSYEDLFYIYHEVPEWARYWNPSGKWLGDFTRDDKVLCGNKTVSSYTLSPYDNDTDSDIWNFEGECNKKDSRKYYCCSDLD